MSEFFYCLTHNTVEEGPGCRGADRMGPYPTADAAEHWRSTHDAREQAWRSDEDDDTDE